jgi:hypothetical protein
MLLGVKAHEVSSSSALLFPIPSIPGWYAEEGASISINPVERMGDSVGFFPFVSVSPVTRRSPAAFGLIGDRVIIYQCAEYELE